MNGVHDLFLGNPTRYLGMIRQFVNMSRLYRKNFFRFRRQSLHRIKRPQQNVRVNQILHILRKAIGSIVKIWSHPYFTLVATQFSTECALWRHGDSLATDIIRQKCQQLKLYLQGEFEHLAFYFCKGIHIKRPPRCIFLSRKGQLHLFTQRR